MGAVRRRVDNMNDGIAASRAVLFIAASVRAWCGLAMTTDPIQRVTRELYARLIESRSSDALSVSAVIDCSPVRSPDVHSYTIYIPAAVGIQVAPVKTTP